MRKTKVVGFSVAPELYLKFEKILKKTYQTKSELFRQMLNSYLELPKSIASGQNASATNSGAHETDLAKILKLYWDLRSTTKTKIILVTLGIIIHQGKILIGARKDNDQWIDNLTWVFPGGEIKSLNFENETIKKIKSETGLNITVESLITSRIHPDSGQKPVQIVAFYFYCTVATSKFKLKPMGNLTKLIWVKPRDIFKYFTGSTSDDVTRFLFTIDQSSTRS